MHDILQSPSDPEGRELPLTLSLSQLHINAGGGGKLLRLSVLHWTPLDSSSRVFSSPPKISSPQDCLIVMGSVQ